MPNRDQSYGLLIPIVFLAEGEAQPERPSPGGTGKAEGISLCYA